LPLASRNEDGTTAVYGDLAERLLLGLVFDPRVLDARAAPLGCGIYELPSGAVTAVVAVPPKADLAHAIWAALDSLKAAGCSLPSGSFATPNDVRFRLVARVLLDTHSLRSQLYRLAVAEEVAIPDTYVAISPRSKLDILAEATSAPMRAGPIWASPLPVSSPSSVSVYGHTTPAESYFNSAYKSELFGMACRKLDREKIRGNAESTVGNHPFRTAPLFVRRRLYHQAPQR